MIIGVHREAVETNGNGDLTSEFEDELKLLHDIDKHRLQDVQKAGADVEELLGVDQVLAGADLPTPGHSSSCKNVRSGSKRSTGEDFGASSSMSSACSSKLEESAEHLSEVGRVLSEDRRSASPLERECSEEKRPSSPRELGGSPIAEKSKDAEFKGTSSSTNFLSVAIPQTSQGPSVGSAPSSSALAAVKSRSTRSQRAMESLLPTVNRVRQTHRRLTVQAGKLVSKFKIAHSRGLSDFVWIFLEEPGSSPAAQLYGLIFSSCIAASVFCTVLMTLDPCPIPFHILTYVDLVFDCIFALELTIRFLCCPNKIRFWRNFYNLIDVVSITPLFVKCVVGLGRPEDGSELQLIVLFWPVIRLLKASRKFGGFRLLTKALMRSAQALPVPLSMLLTIVVGFASILYWVEPRHNVKSLPHAMWLVLLTISTVGFSDAHPETDVGKAFCALLILIGGFYMAMPLSIVGTNFTEVWAERDTLLLMDKTQQRLVDWGYSADDVSVAFRYFDKSGTGELDLSEFTQMMQEMHLGLPEARIVELFQTFDEDDSGAISAEEFMRLVFPHQWRVQFYAKHRTMAMTSSASTTPGSLQGSKSLTDNGDISHQFDASKQFDSSHKFGTPASFQAASSTELKKSRKGDQEKKEKGDMSKRQSLQSIISQERKRRSLQDEPASKRGSLLSMLRGRAGSPDPGHERNAHSPDPGRLSPDPHSGHQRNSRLMPRDSTVSVDTLQAPSCSNRSIIPGSSSARAMQKMPSVSEQTRFGMAGSDKPRRPGSTLGSHDNGPFLFAVPRAHSASPGIWGSSKGSQRDCARAGTKSRQRDFSGTASSSAAEDSEHQWRSRIETKVDESNSRLQRLEDALSSIESLLRLGNSGRCSTSSH